MLLFPGVNYMLSELFMHRVYDSLNSKTFRSSDFSISQARSNDSAKTGNITLTIKYRYKKEFHIVAILNRSQCDNVAISPGQIMKIDIKNNLAIQDFLTSTIPTWLSTLTRYFDNDPYTRRAIKNEQRIDELEKKIDEALGDLDQDFLEDEITLLKERLNNMEKELTEKLNQQIQDQETLNVKIKEIHQDVQTLKNQAGPLDKKNWLLSFYTKLYLWNESNPSLLPKSLLHVGYKFLPESVQNVIPSEIIDSTVDSLLPESPVEKDTVKHK